MTNQLRYRINKLQSLGLIISSDGNELWMGHFLIKTGTVRILNRWGRKSVVKQVKYYRKYNCF